jgi:pilus assembly protein Flp/PilA
VIVPAGTWKWEVRMTGLRTLCANAGQGFRRFCADESGATAVEYAMIAVGISVVIVATVAAIGTSVKNNFTSVSAGFN